MKLHLRTALASPLLQIEPSVKCPERLAPENMDLSAPSPTMNVTKGSEIPLSRRELDHDDSESSSADESSSEERYATISRPHSSNSSFGHSLTGVEESEKGDRDTTSSQSWLGKRDEPFNRCYPQGTSVNLPLTPVMSQDTRILECPFELIGCSKKYHIQHKYSWIDHSLSHFRAKEHKTLPPTHNDCPFCAESFSHDNPITSWNMRMNHIAKHHEKGLSLAHRRPDFGLLQYLRQQRLITDMEFHEIEGVNKAPHRAAAPPSPPLSALDDDEATHTPVYLGRNENQRRRPRGRPHSADSHTPQGPNIVLCPPRGPSFDSIVSPSKIETESVAEKQEKLPSPLNQPTDTSSGMKCLEEEQVSRQLTMDHERSIDEPELLHARSTSPFQSFFELASPLESLKLGSSQEMVDARVSLDSSSSGRSLSSILSSEKVCIDRKHLQNMLYAVIESLEGFIEPSGDDDIAAALFDDDYEADQDPQSSLQNERDKHLYESEEFLSQIIAYAKHHLIDRAMSDVYKRVEFGESNGFRKCPNAETRSQASSSTYVDASNKGTNQWTGGGKRRRERSNSPGGGDDGSKRGRSNSKNDSRHSVQLPLACPFNKQDPTTYRPTLASNYRYQTCVRPVTRLK